MNEFRAELFMWIVNARNENDILARLRREVKLPFAPYPGLRIVTVDDKERISVGGELVKRVYWDVNESKFYCHMEDCKTSSELEGTLPEWTKNGWVVQDESGDVREDYATSVTNNEVKV